MSETQAILTFWGGVMAGLLIGGLLGWWRGMFWGVAVGCLLIGSGASVAAGSLAWKRWQFVSHSVLVSGRLLGQHAGPQVEFAGSDGRMHQVHGLGGSQSAVQEGGAVPVRYPAADPSQAIVADFQNLWGGVLAFTLFGALPLAFGAFFLAMALQGRRESRSGDSRVGVAGKGWSSRPGERAVTMARFGSSRTVEAAPELAPWRERLSGNLLVCGNFVMVLGFGFAIFANDTAAKLGRAFLVIGLAACLYGVALLLRKDDWMGPAIAFIVGLGFVLFGGGAILVG